MTVKLRTRYRIVFLYREEIKNKCVGTPLYYKLSGAVDGDAYEEYKQFAEEVLDTISEKCIIKDGSGVCIITYVMKEKFVFKEKFIIEEYVYKAKVQYEFKVRKDGVKIAYKINTKTGTKVQTNYKKARKNHNSQQSRMRVTKRKYDVRQLKRKRAYSLRKDEKQASHRVAKKKVLKQFQLYQGCYSPDMAYKGR